METDLLNDPRGFIAVALALIALLIPIAAQADPSDAASRAFYGQVEDHLAAGSVEELQKQAAGIAERIERAQMGGSAVAPAERYALAYVKWRCSQLLDRKKGKKERKELLQDAQEDLGPLLEEGSDHAEAYALLGSLIGDGIGGAFGGMIQGPKASAALDRAQELAPENPRVALQRGISSFFTPKTFGGGSENAETELRRARDLFERQGAGDAWPFWGRFDAIAWLGLVLAEVGRRDEARALYEEALRLKPDHRWVRDELMPALD